MKAKRSKRFKFPTGFCTVQFQFVEMMPEVQSNYCEDESPFRVFSNNLPTSLLLTYNYDASKMIGECNLFLNDGKVMGSATLSVEHLLFYPSLRFTFIDHVIVTKIALLPKSGSIYILNDQLLDGAASIIS